MKKILTVLLSLLMIFISPIGVLAEDQANPTSGQVTLTATQTSSYYVLLPTSVDVLTSPKTFDIQVKGDVDSAKKIEITEDKGTLGQDINYLVDNADEENMVAISTSVSGAINGASIKSQYDDAVKITFTVTHAALTAGTYTCQLPLVIALKPIA